MVQCQHYIEHQKTSTVITMKYTSTLALILGLSCPTPALADGYYVDTCRDADTDWVLALNQADGSAAFFKEVGRVRTGTYVSQGDRATITAGEMRITLHVARGNASWVAGDAKGLLSRRYVGSDRPTRWIDAPAYTPPMVADGPPDDPFAAGVWARNAPPVPPPVTQRVSPPPQPDGKLCDFEHHCYGSDTPPNSDGGTTIAPTGDASHVPITVDGDSALVAVIVGGFPLTALIDSGATSLSLPQNVADTLLGSGQATEGDPVHVTHAGGDVFERRSVIVSSVSIGGHTVHNVQAVVELSGSQALLGFKVLREMSPRFAIDTARSQLVFE